MHALVLIYANEIKTKWLGQTLCQH